MIRSLQRVDLQRLKERFGASSIEPIDLGFSGATVVRLQRRGETLYYKGGPGVAAEADRLSWLGTTDIPCPRLLDRGDSGNDERLRRDRQGDEGQSGECRGGERGGSESQGGERDGGVRGGGEREDGERQGDESWDGGCCGGEGRGGEGVGVGVGEWMLTAGLGGRDASQEWAAAERPGVLGAVAEGIRQLHALTECPFESPYPGSRGAVTHGDYTAPNVFVDPETLRFSGLLDLSRLGLGDPYVDFALMYRSLAGPLNPQYGGRSAARDFVVRAGGDPDDPRLAHFTELGVSGLY